MSLLRLLRGSQTILSRAAKSSKIYTTRCQSTSPQNSYTLPDHPEWRAIFPTSPSIVRDRVSLANPETADALAKGILTGEEIVAGTNKIPLAEADPRVTIVPMSGFDWDTYQYIEKQGLLNDVETIPWENGGKSIRLPFRHAEL
ncbi:hypothetical protein PHLCEN_2v304 [Hermanssonia centrifuga]|uniref:Uncharacterized protein n=1 Tax=Hermanssonia centrifuga TaxID=98765 RepID=A0A2R6S6E6_9APHY|nr:hypothetical protein PHLCEN_2v304 [Hermanssonia centrifuga]